MIRGYFAEGRPFVDALLRFPSGAFGAARLLIDTGADRTIIHPGEYLRLGLGFGDFGDFPQDSAFGIGGEAAYRRVPVQILLEHETGRFDRIRLRALIARPTPSTRRLPSLLGRDALDLYVLTMDRRGDRVLLERSPDAEDV